MREDIIQKSYFFYYAASYKKYVESTNWRKSRQVNYWLSTKIYGVNQQKRSFVFYNDDVLMKKCTFVMWSLRVKTCTINRKCKPILRINFLGDIGSSFLLYLKRWHGKPPELGLIVRQASDNYHTITWWTASFLNIASSVQVSYSTFVFNIVSIKQSNFPWCLICYCGTFSWAFPFLKKRLIVTLQKGTTKRFKTIIIRINRLHVIRLCVMRLQVHARLNKTKFAEVD